MYNGLRKELQYFNTLQLLVGDSLISLFRGLHYKWRTVDDLLKNANKAVLYGNFVFRTELN